MDSYRSVARRALLGVLLLAMAFTACRFGPAIGQVQGKVTFKGAPITEGMITFYNPETGDSGEATLELDGAYKVTSKDGGLVVGEYKVFVTPAMRLDDSDPKTPPSMVEKPAPNIPTKYRGESTTPLTAKIVEGKNDLDFNLTP